MRSLAFLPLVLLLTVAVPAPAHAGTVPLSDWLVAGPVQSPCAAVDSIAGWTATAAFLSSNPVAPEEFWPAEGSTIVLAPGAPSTFAPGRLTFAAPPPGAPGLTVAAGAVYLDCPAWQKGKLEVRGRAAFKLYLDGEELISRPAPAKADSAAESKPVTLDQGLHRLLLLTAAAGRDSLGDWSLAVTYDSAKDTLADGWTPSPTLSPVHPFDITDYSLQEDVGDLKISPDGRWLAVVTSRRTHDKLKLQSHLGVWDVKDKRKVWDYGTAVEPRALGWSPDGRSLLLGLKGDDDATDLYLLTAGDWLLKRVGKNLEDASGFRWAPDGRGVYYLHKIAWKAGDEKDYKVMWSLRDREPGWRDQAEFRYFDIDGGTSALVARLKYTPDVYAVAPDGRHLYLYRTVAAEGRPYQKMEFWAVPTRGGTPQLIFSQRTIRQDALAISPDGKLAAFSGPVAPVEPDDDPADAHNEAYQDLWIVDLAAGTARNMSLDFAPSVNTSAYGTGDGCDFVWKDDGKLYFSAFDRGGMLLCTYDPQDGEITGRRLGTPGFGQLTIPTGRSATLLAYRGDRLARIGDVQWYDLARGRGGELVPLNRNLHRVTTPPARVTPYDFVDSDGVTVPGYLYYPAGYDSTRSYPLIVDTYGGVIGFGEGWLWGNAFFSDRGYFDYVPVPRGAAGYGLAFADAHCGDWGPLAARDINEGVRHVIAHVAGVDSARIGFDSGSYGGFLAMYLMAMDKNDPDFFPYATAVGGYGISDLADYWGIGAWGSWYMELSAPGKLPWATPQWFTEHSPVFHADNITNPLLLVHGDADVNVPVGNSDEMYTALKLLDRTVTFVRWPGEGHGVARDRVHYLERKRIELEWFDKWLRGRDGAWNARMKGELEK